MAIIDSFVLSEGTKIFIDDEYLAKTKEENDRRKAKFEDTVRRIFMDSQEDE